MPLPFSDSPAHRACLARVGRVNINHGQTGGFSFVSNEVLKLPECPAMQPRSNAPPGLDVGADMRQVFHADFTGSIADSLRNKGLAGFVVDVLNMPPLTPGDSLEFALGGAATVGLETTAMGKVNVPLVAEIPAAPDLAGAGCCEVIFPNIYPANAATRDWRSVGKVEDKVEIPDALAGNELRLLSSPARQQVALMLAADERNLGAPVEGEQGECVTLDRVSAPIKVDGSGSEDDCRDRLVLCDPLVGLQRLVGIRHTVDGLANHLAAESRELLAHCVIGQVVQGYAVPASMLHGKRNDGVTCSGVGIGKRTKRSHVLRGGQQLKRCRSLFHIGNIIVPQERSKPPPFLPDLNGGVSRRH